MIKIDIKAPLGYTEGDIKAFAAELLPIEAYEIKSTAVVKQRLNLSDKQKIHYDLTVALELSEDRERGLLKMKKKVSPYERDILTLPEKSVGTRPVVVGFGPSGMFCALALALAGLRPIVYERGLPVEERCRKVELFSTLGILDTECNVQFGEGGAGTYSDGKLKVGSMDKYKRWILEELIAAGAPSDILFSTTAHLGTDKLSEISRRVREKIISLGAEVNFGARLISITTKNGRLVGGRVEKNGETSDFEADTLFLGAGHSAVDTFELLDSLGLALTPKGFGIGVRMEHPREYINELVYGKGYPTSLESASYHLVTHLKNGRSVYSFCMCPGGSVVTAASEECGIVTNGMSEYKRDADNSNAAFLVSVTPDDFPDSTALSGLRLQRRIERAAYYLTGSYRAPAARLSTFLRGEKSTSFGTVTPSYKLGTEYFSPDEYLPEYISDSLKSAVSDFDEWMPGFYYPDAVLTGPETRTTSPVRVERGESGEAIGLAGLYPIGEGAGYAGGIVSSARDGALAAEKYILSI